MYKVRRATATSISKNTSYQGETLEQKIQRIVNNKEPIKDGAPLIYTDRSEGVKPAYDIRTDRFEVAVDAMEGVTKAHLAKREERAKVIPMKQEETGKEGGETGGQSIPATDK